MFKGEIIVAITPNARSIIVAMMASHPDLEYVLNSFTSLTKHSFPQYTCSESKEMCPKCLHECFIEGKMHMKDVGHFESDMQQDQQCSPHSLHDHEDGGKEVLSAAAGIESCRSHKRTKHSFFINYRVNTEGCTMTPGELPGGAVQLLYEKLAVRKTKEGKSLFVFWDKKCLNYGQDWEIGFMNGLVNSQVIILLISNKVFLVFPLFPFLFFLLELYFSSYLICIITSYIQCATGIDEHLPKCSQKTR